MTDLGGGRLVGRTISHYRVIAPLGVGGMGVVYRGEDVRLGRPVAIKLVADDFADDAQAVARLRAEARAASALNHPNICTIHDIGTEEGHPFIVMELMEGQTLRDRLGRGRPKVHELVDLGIQVADALQAAHSAGIIHRDIKPANVFVTGRGHVKVLDFGLAKLAATHPGPDSATLATEDLTAAGTTLGTVSYMSPEQAAGDELDGRTDLFSLGVLLYECATGRRPFDGKTNALTLSAILNNSPVPPGNLNPELPARLQEIILTCLEKDRELRYQSGADLRADLKRVRRDLESGRVTVEASTTQSLASNAAVKTVSRVDATKSAAHTTKSAAHTPTDPAPAARSRATVAAAALVVLVAVGAGGYALFRRPAPARTEPAPVATPAAPPATGTAERTDRVQDPLAQARSSFAGGNYRAALAYVSEVLASDPGQADALKIRDQASAAIARFDESIRLTRQRLSLNDVQGAARSLGDARDIDPTAPVVSELAAVISERVRDPNFASASRSARSNGSEPARTPPASGTSTPTRSAAEPASAQPAQPQQTATVSVPQPPAAPASPAAPPPAAPADPTTSAADNGGAASRAAAARTPAPPPPTPAPAPSDRATAPAASSPSADDDEAVRRIVASYARAIENKDLALFRSVKPNLSREEERRLSDGFRAVTSQQVHLTLTSVDVREQDATVIAMRRDVIDAGGRRQTVESRQTFRLARTATGWVITDIR